MASNSILFSENLDAFKRELLALDLSSCKKDEYINILLSLDGALGYLGYVDNGDSIPITEILNSEGEFLSSLKNIMHRRAYFYLSKYQEVWVGDEKIESLDLLIKYFSKFRRTSPLRNNDLDAIIKSAQCKHTSELSPLYETFVDSELFTALSYLQGGACRGELEEILYRKLISILDETLDENLRPKRFAERHLSVKDEANIYWALRLISSKFKDGVALCGRHRTPQEIFVSLNSMLSDNPLGRISPSDEDKIFEITPEILSNERTNLYVALNVLILLDSCSDYEHYKSLVKRDVDNLKHMYVGGFSTNNIYLSCLQSECLDLYQSVYYKETASDMEQVMTELSNLPEGNLKEQIIYHLREIKPGVNIEDIRKKLTLVREIVATTKDIWSVVKPFFELLWQGEIRP